MPQHMIEIGSVPADEDCAQTGSKHYDFADLCRLECRAYIAAIKRVYGEPPEGARLYVGSAAHDFGTYYEVRCKYEIEDAACREYAERIENGLSKWSDAKMWAPITWWNSKDPLGIMRDEALWDMEKNPRHHTELRNLEAPPSEETKPAD